jgi:hypothetical protein
MSFDFDYVAFKSLTLASARRRPASFLSSLVNADIMGHSFPPDWPATLSSAHA